MEKQTDRKKHTGTEDGRTKQTADRHTHTDKRIKKQTDTHINKQTGRESALYTCT